MTPEAPTITDIQSEEIKSTATVSVKEKAMGLNNDIDLWLNRISNQMAVLGDLPLVRNSTNIISEIEPTADIDQSPEQIAVYQKEAEQLIGDIAVEISATEAAINGIDTHPELEQASGLLKHMREVTAAMLTKISERLGTNPGGWHIDKESGRKFYLKFYSNPDQARIEYIANAIYQKLGVKAPASELWMVDDQLAIASPEIPDAQLTTKNDQQRSDDVRDAFVVDAWLANWDVVGLEHDNIVRGADGGLYRIDNGGSLIFRAQGAPKEYIADKVRELETMRRPEYPAGQVFGDLSEQDLAKQAQALVNKLTEADIKQIVASAELSAGTEAQLIAAMIGRRRSLIDRFKLTEIIKSA